MQENGKCSAEVEMDEVGPRAVALPQVNNDSLHPGLTEDTT